MELGSEAILVTPERVVYSHYLKQEKPPQEKELLLSLAPGKNGLVRGWMVDQRALGGFDRLTTPAPTSAMTAKVMKATW